MQVLVGKAWVTPPTRADHWLKVPRTVLLPSQDDVYRADGDDDELINAHLNGTADMDTRMILECSGIVCDMCNDPIMYPYIWCLIIGGRYCWGAMCEKCKQGYSSRPLKEYVLQKRG